MITANDLKINAYPLMINKRRPDLSG